MKYFRWQAYDRTGCYHDGATKAERFEEVAMNLMSRRLYPSSIIEIQPGEYKHYKSINKKIDKLRKFEYKLTPHVLYIDPPKKKYKWIIAGIVLMAIVIWWIL